MASKFKFTDRFKKKKDDKDNKKKSSKKEEKSKSPKKSSKSKKDSSEHDEDDDADGSSSITKAISKDFNKKAKSWNEDQLADDDIPEIDEHDHDGDNEMDYAFLRGQRYDSNEPYGDFKGIYGEISDSEAAEIINDPESPADIRMAAIQLIREKYLGY